MSKIDFNSEAAAPRFALKEWSATIRALAEGRQILLLRKGGILDDDGVFQLEHERFWLQPTYLHQDATLVQPPHRDLLEAHEERGENRDFVRLRYFAEVAQTFSIPIEDAGKLRAAKHIYSANYLDLRFSYKVENPLLCVALRVFDSGEYSRLPMQPQWMGCRSWIDLGKSPRVEKSRATLNDEDFAAQLAALRAALAP